MAWVTGFFGFVFFVQLIRWSGRWIELNGDTITSSRRHQFDVQDIVELDKKKWDKKGIAYIKYQVDGKAGQLILDDCNYVRDTTQQILRHIEANIEPAQIVNGKPEPPLEPEKEAVETEEAS